MPSVLVTRRIPESALALLRAGRDVELRVAAEDRPLSPAELHVAARGADAVVALLHDRIDAAFLDAAGPRLRVVANVAVGYDNIDVGACARRGVLVTNTPGVLTDATADLAIALMLIVTRRLGEGERLIRRREPWAWHMGFMLGAGLRGRTLGIVGYGKIGAATARRAGAFGMKVVHAGRGAASARAARARESVPARPDRRPSVDVAAQAVGLEELLERADVVSLHCPLTAETHHLIDARALARMRADAYLVNTARGPVVDEAALAAALRAGTIAGAALDVYEREPEVHPGLLDCENAVLIPHLGSATVETRAAMAELAARNVLAVLAGRPALTPVAASGP